MRYLPYGAAFAISAVLVVCYFAFPRQVETVKRERVKVDPYKTFQQSGVTDEPINGEYGSRCVFRENRRGITQGTSPPQESDTIVVVCRTYKLEGGS